ncbi:MAG TPA: hypothetical protein VJA21_01690 [Verrucomicrobiae bacterium]
MSDWITFLPYLIVGAAVAIFFVLMMSVSLWEKQYIRQLEPAARDALGPTSPYFEAMNLAAPARSFIPCGTFYRLPRTAAANTYMAAWLSPDRTTLACIIGGKVAKLKFLKTLLLTWVEDEKFLVTRDDFGETDHSHTLEVEVVLNADFEELVIRHEQRLGVCGSLPRPLDPASVAALWERIEEIRARKLVAGGLARFVDEPRGIWRYTFRGGWKNFSTVFTQIKDHKKYADRLKKKRPGLEA